jgi:predicted O-methyltransferase YrrM
LEPLVGLKSTVLRLLERANYALVHADVLERERRLATEVLKQLRAVNAAEAERLAEAAHVRQDPKVRPLTKITGDADFAGASIDRKWIGELLASQHFAAVAAAYRDYPPRSHVSSTERAFLFCLIRAMKPKHVAEIGTAFCGTSEIIARALWENGAGVLHTTDPFGADRCPLIIRQWPFPLQDIIQFRAKSSMDFIFDLTHANIMLDIAFVDGNHDLEFVAFDIAAAARLLRAGGIMIIDNSEQSGPYHATARFMRHNPDWIELGEAISSFRRSKPFAAARSSVPDGGFLLLKAPDHYAIGEVPRSTGQIGIATARVDGVTMRLACGASRGRLHYHIILRAFRNANREIAEYKRTGHVNLDATTGSALEHRFAESLVSQLDDRHGDCNHTVEIELAWEGADAHQTIQLSTPPQPLLTEAAPRDRSAGSGADLLPQTGNASGL